jgi:DNA-binding response OmpR family regulator
VVEDHDRLASGLRANLELEGHQVEVAGDAATGLGRARAFRPDLVILDLMLPDQSGYRVLRELRESGDQTPVLILTALGDEAEKVRGFRLGADDYVTKPFGLLELLARVEALLRRAGRNDGPPRPTEYRFGEIAVYPGTRTVTRGGELVPLRPRELDLLLALLRHNGDAVARADLLTEVWGYHEEVESRTVDVHMAELRRKLEADPANPVHLLTVRKVGYRLAC